MYNILADKISGHPIPSAGEMSMANPKFHVHRRARLAFDDLTASERKALEERIAPLADLPAEKWSSTKAVRLDTSQPLYLLRIDDSLRALVRPGRGGQPEIVDFVRHETLERFFKGATASASRT